MIAYYIKDRNFGVVSCIPSNLNELRRKVDQATREFFDTFELEVCCAAPCNEIAKQVLFNSNSVASIIYDYRVACKVCEFINDMYFACKVEPVWIEF